MKFDIAVIGAGPAGSALSFLLNSNLRVALINRAHAKPCGGLLAPDAQKALASLALSLPKEILVDPQLFAVKTLDLTSNLTRTYQRFYLNMDRAKFDNWLLSLAAQKVTVFDGAATQITKMESGFKIQIGMQEIETKYLVGADGADSFVRRTFFAGHKIRVYTAVQQRFAAQKEEPFYHCFFDAQTTDCYSWGVQKDTEFIFGGAYAIKDSRRAFEAQKVKLNLHTRTALSTEACLVLRPKGWSDFCLGADNVFLIGEAAGFISPSSLEGISWALRSAIIISKVFNSAKQNKNAAYRRAAFGLRLKIWLKLFKCPFLYNPFLRKLVMRSGLKSIN